MSGLLVKSTLIMRENLQELNSLGMAELPVLLGGAALTRTYVEKDLREVYEGRVFYGRDAFEGLNTLDKLMTMKRGGEDDPTFGRVPSGRVLPERGQHVVQRRHAESFVPEVGPEVGAPPKETPDSETSEDRTDEQFWVIGSQS
jgi:5-methyltetrahydrofolate--homocysteine methyltransferase